MNLISDQVDKKEIEIIVRELKKVLGNDVIGDVTEFGCYLGTTSVYLAKTLMQTPERSLYVYDSFAGLPEKNSKDISPLGVSFKAGELLASKKQFIKNMHQHGVPVPHITKAWFADIKPDDLPEKVAFAYLDGDYYMSIIDSLRSLNGRLSPGATIVVDDYGNAALPGVARAIDEWLKSHVATLKVEHSLAIIYVKR